MSCYTPNVGLLTTYLNGEKFMSKIRPSTQEYRDYLAQFADGPMVPPFKSVEVVEVPCKKCIGCQLDKSRDWAVRAILEGKEDPQNAYFLTLTYSNENLKYTQKGYPTLDPLYVRKFLKRYREEFRRKDPDAIGSKYLGCGEYGSQFSRPHYHILLFHLPLDVVPSTTPKGSPCYTCPSLERAWGKGFVYVDKVTFASAAYVARYVLKKQYDDKQAWYLDRVPEYNFMSTRPGLGFSYFDEHKLDIYLTDKIPVKTADGVITIKPPAYFDRLMKKENEDLIANVKEIRRQHAEWRELDRQSRSTLTLDEQRKVDLEAKLLQIAKLHRNYEDEG